MAQRKKRGAKSGAASDARRKSRSRRRSIITRNPSKPRKRTRATDRDRLVTLTSLTRGKGKDKLYTMKEIADSLGISTRTLRRVKNVPGYDLAPRTYKRIHSDLVDNYRTIAPDLRKTFDIPKTVIIPKPREFKSKSGASRTLAFPSEGMSGIEKASFISDMHKPGKFKYWHFRVRVPIGVAISGRVDSDPKSIEYNNEDEDIFYMSGPFLFSDEDGSEVQAHIDMHEDAGREVVEVFFTEMLRGNE